MRFFFWWMLLTLVFKLFDVEKLTVVFLTSLNQVIKMFVSNYQLLGIELFGYFYLVRQLILFFEYLFLSDFIGLNLLFLEQNCLLR